jgi:hypothetical protein
MPPVGDTVRSEPVVASGNLTHPAIRRAGLLLDLRDAASHGQLPHDLLLAAGHGVPRRPIPTFQVVDRQVTGNLELSGHAGSIYCQGQYETMRATVQAPDRARWSLPS